MPKLPNLKAKELIKILKQLGFVEKRQKGSHLILVLPKDNRMTVVPIHNQTIGKGLLHKIVTDDLKMTVAEFITFIKR